MHADRIKIFFFYYYDDVYILFRTIIDNYRSIRTLADANGTDRAKTAVPSGERSLVREVSGEQDACPIEEKPRPRATDDLRQRS